MFEDNGNKCGKCQNHDYEVLKKGHARDCPFKKCDCLKCRLLDARSDILQVISGKETKLKGTKKDPNCGFCQNHGVKILRKGHVRSCGFGQERHFRLDNCFSCEVHYIRNEVNRLQIKMRRAMKEDRTLSEEQRKTAREAITRDEVEKVCEMARLARRKRGALVPAGQQASGESSAGNATPWPAHCSYHSPSPSAASLVLVKEERRTPTMFGGDATDANATPLGVGPLRVQKCRRSRQQLVKQQQQPYSHHDQVATSASVWRPWSQQQQQIVAAIAAHQQQQQQRHTQQAHLPLPHQHLQQQFIHQHEQQTGMAAMGARMQSAQIGMPNSYNNLATSAMGNSVGGGGNQLGRLLSQQDHDNHQQHLQTISNFNLPLVVAQPQPPQQQQQQQLYQPVNLQCDNSQLARRGLGGGGPLALPPPPPLNSRSQTPHQAGAHTAGPLGGLFNPAAAMLQSNMLLNSALHNQHQHTHHNHQRQQRQYSDHHQALVPVTSASRVASPLEVASQQLGSPEPPAYLSGQHSRSPSVRSLSPIAADAANMSIHITCAPAFPPAAANHLLQMQSEEQPQLQPSQRAVQEQQVFNTLFRLLVAQFTQQQQQQQNFRRPQ